MQTDPAELDAMTPEQLTAMLAQKARVIAERAFWDSVEWRLRTGIQGGNLPSQLAPLLSELGTELSELVTDSFESEQLSEQYAAQQVNARLASRVGQQAGGANVTAMMSMLEQLTKALEAVSSPHRITEAQAATQQVQSALMAALSSTPSDELGSKLAPALTQALRLLMTHLKLVKLDAANARLMALAQVRTETTAAAKPV